MEIIIRESEQDAVALAVALITKLVQEKPNCVLGLCTGPTMAKVYAGLVDQVQQRALSLADATTFNLGEYIELNGGIECAHRIFMERHLFDHVNIDRDNTHFPEGRPDTVKEDCANYEALIERAGGVDLQLLGISDAGHIGFNAPSMEINLRTHTRILPPTSNWPDGDFPKNAVPQRVITMGLRTILDSRRCVLLAVGAEKAPVIARSMEGPLTSTVSASALQLHPRCTVIVDRAASQELQGIEYYEWIFKNEPEWQEYN